MDFNQEGEKAYKNTREYRQKQNEIIQEINSKFAVLRASETNFFKRLHLWFLKQMEIRKALSKLQSKEILFLSNPF